MTKATALLLALLAAGSLQGCTDAQWADTLHVIKPIGKFACETATMLCAKGGDPTACAAIAVACEGISLITSGGFEEGTGPADAQGAEHTIDGEDP